MKAYIKEICSVLSFPQEALEAMERAWDSISGSPGAYDIWLRRMGDYEEDIHMDYKAALGEIDRAAAEAGVHVYTAELLFFLCLSRRLKELYIQHGIDLQIFHDSCMDMHWKLMECRKMYGIWGTFVAFWDPGFFELTRFALGRLQFELIPFPKSYEEAGRKKPEEMKQVINVHIPSAGKLSMDECHASYRMAAEFFSDAFPGDTVAFYCESWMLYEPHRNFLKPDSGVVAFMSEYDIYKTGEEDGDLWRIFNCKYDGDVSALPEDTSMQRAYKAWLAEGRHAGYGEGLFYMKKKESPDKREF